MARMLVSGVVFALAFVSFVSGGTRENMGIYGGTVTDYAYDEINQKIIASVAGPLSCFASDDSGATWYAAFPEESLEVEENMQSRGWAGRAVSVVSHGGITVVVTNEEGGTLQSSVITADGANWRTCLDFSLSSQAAQAYKTATGNDVSAGNPSCAAVMNGKVYVGIKNIVYFSEDTAKTWMPIPYPDASSLNLPNNTGASIHGIYPVATDPSGLSFYLIVSEGGASPDIRNLQFTADGASFAKVTVSDPDLGEMTALRNLWINAVSPDTMVVNVHTYGPPTRITNFYRTLDGGVAWVKINPDGGSGVQVDEVVYVAQDNDLPGPDHVRLMSGRAYSDDLGDNWIALSGVNNIRSLMFHIPGSDVYLANQENNPMRSAAGIDGPYSMNNYGLQAITIAQIAQRPDVLSRVYLATYSGIGFTSRFGDSTISNEERWQPPYGNFPILPAGCLGVTAISISPYDSLLVFADGGNGVMKTVNGGANNTDWSMISWGNVAGLSGNENGTIMAFAFYSADTIFAGMGSNTSGALIQTLDRGVSWSAVSTFPKVKVNSIAVASNSTTGARVIYAATGAAGGLGTLYRSSDAGVTWDSTPGPAATIGTKTRMPVRDIVVKPGQTDTLFIACGDNLDCAAGYSIDGGVTIETFDNGFTGGTEMTSITLSKTNPDSVFIAMRREIGAVDFASATPVVNKYFKGLPGELIKDVFYDGLVMGTSVGFFSVSGPNQTVSTGKPSGISREIADVWLAPKASANGSIIVSFHVPRASTVKIDLLSLDGKKISSKVFSNVAAGTHTADLGAVALNHGVYCVRFTDGRVNLCKTVLVFRNKR